MLLNRIEKRIESWDKLFGQGTLLPILLVGALPILTGLILWEGIALIREKRKSKLLCNN